MSNKKIDHETALVFARGAHLEELVSSNGWKEAKQMLMDKINDLNAVTNTIFEGKTNDQIADEMKQRASVVSIFKEWVDEVESEAEKNKDNRAGFDANKKESYIMQE
jgi:regulator of PEP synthase PpsR (kinase-PPPase family)